MSFFSKKWVKFGLIPVAIIAGAGVIYAANFSGEEPNIYEVVRGDVREEVLLTGSVKALRELDLGFERGGRIAGSYVKVGDQVGLGEDLVRLESSEVYANLLSAQAAYKQAKADLAALVKGKRAEEIAIKETKVRNADQSLTDYRKLLANSILDGYTKVDDAIRAKADDTFDNPRTSPKFAFTLTDQTLRNQLEVERLEMEQKLVAYQENLQSASTSTVGQNSAAAAAEDALSHASIFLSNLAAALNSLYASSNLSESTLDGYRTDVAAGRTNVNTAISNLSAALNNVRTAEANLQLAEDELRLDRASATPEAVLSAEAKAESAEANVLKYQAELSKMTIRSPIEGVVTKQDQRAGEIVAAGEAVVSVISDEGLEIEASAPEIDVSGLQVGMEAVFTLDAFPNTEFTGVVIGIDPAETLLEGVPTYNVIFKIDNPELGVKPGMTANITILAEEKRDVLMVPFRAVTTQSDGSYVDVLGPDDTRVPRKIITGLRGTNGNTEVLQGLSEGEKIFLDKETK